MIGIYKITSPSGKIYIGQSIDIKRRFNLYKRNACKGQPILYRSLIKYGHQSHIFEVLCECNASELNNKERYYQDLFLAVGSNGLNCMLTKSKDKSGGHNKNTKLLISQKKTGSITSAETKIKLSISLKKNSKAIAERMRTLNTGKKFTDSHKSKISKANKGITKSEEHKDKLRAANLGKKREFSKIILDLNTGIFYGSVQDAANASCKKYSTLAGNLNGQKVNNTQFLYV